jgi:hypothetical protein
LDQAPAQRLKAAAPAQPVERLPPEQLACPRELSCDQPLQPPMNREAARLCEDVLLDCRQTPELMTLHELQREAGDAVLQPTPAPLFEQGRFQLALLIRSSSP